MWRKAKNIYHLIVAFLANIWFGFPSKKLIVIGVTGTDGKTTTVNLIHHILRSAGKKVVMVSTVGGVIGKTWYETGFHITTPSSFFLQSFIAKAVTLENKYLVLEVTSHALDQNRVWRIDFQIGVLTNVTREHLDYHKTFENYLEAKLKLLQGAKIAVVNRDDTSYSHIRSRIGEKKIITYGLAGKAEFSPKNFPFKTQLFGDFNSSNILAATAVCSELGIKKQDIQKAVATFLPPLGRQEVVFRNDFTVMIDFAHTPNSLEEILSELHKTVSGRIIHVFGSAGERDRQKRPEMGKISARYSNIIILTAEDPRSEPIEKIMDEIESGINLQESRNKKTEVYKVPDRQEAINKAILLAKKGDLVLLTGKGHERSMNYGKKEVSWNEQEAVKKALEAKSIKV